MMLTRETLGQWIDAVDAARNLIMNKSEPVLLDLIIKDYDRVRAQMYDLYKWWGEPARKNQDYDVWKQRNSNNGHWYFVGFYGKAKVARTNTLFNCIKQCYEHACDRNPLNTQVIIANNTDEQMPDGIRLYKNHGRIYNCASLYTTHDRQLWHA